MNKSEFSDSLRAGLSQLPAAERGGKWLWREIKKLFIKKES